MFYSDTLSKVENSFTVLDPCQVFSGEYWDEFGMTSHLLPNRAEVLMLGLADGGGIRPIMASTKSISLLAVDSDLPAIQRCKSRFEKNFPKIPFATEVADAFRFVSQTTVKFDCIWVDLYTPNEHSDLNFDVNFMGAIQQRLKPGGIVLMNAYGLPNQFEPLKQHGAQSLIAMELSNVFPYVAAIPYRRNLTFMAAFSQPALTLAQPNASLNELDAETFGLIGKRLRGFQQISKPNCEKKKNKSASYAEINRSMMQNWMLMVDEFKAFGAKISAPVDLIPLIEDEAVMRKILQRGLGGKVSICVPILAAGESRLRDLKVDWCFQWFFENAARMTPFEADIWLTQLWSMVLQPSGRYRLHRDAMKKHIGGLL